MPMVSSPSSGSSSSLSRDAVRFSVLMGPDDGTRPTIDDEDPTLEPLAVQISAGAQRVDAVRLRYNLATAQVKIEDGDTAPLGSNRIVEVRATDTRGNFTRVLAWGKFSSLPIELSGESEKAEFVARLDPFLFGVPLEGFEVWKGSNPLKIEEHITFNPSIDDNIEGNMSSKKNTASGGGDYNLFLDPESMLTGTAQAQHSGEEISEWDMASAVNALCWLLNPDEKYIKNPDLQDLQDLFDGFDSSLLRNMPIALGLYLPDALDALLKPFGYWWYLDNWLDDPSAQSQSQIVLFKRGDGQAMEVFADRWDDSISSSGTNINSIKVETSLAQMANVVHGCSDPGIFQGTFPLYPAWSAGLDSSDIWVLTKGSLSLENIDVGRKWVCNEAGDYTANAASHRPAISLLDLTSVLGPFQIRRRVFKHCLSMDADDHSIGFWVEWYNKDKENPDADPGGWERVPWSHSILHKELGIYFEEDVPPFYLWRYVTEGPPSAVTGTAWPFGLRITASVQGDRRRWGRAIRQDSSPNGADVTLVLDLSRRFPWRAEPAGGAYQNVLSDSFNADTTDPESPGEGQTTIQSYCETVRDWQDAAILSASIVLDGADHGEYQIGDVISKVAGREIALNAKQAITPGLGVRHPQIVGVNYLLGDQQRIELVMETFRKEEFPELVNKGEGRKVEGQRHVKHSKA